MFPWTSTSVDEGTCRAVYRPLPVWRGPNRKWDFFCSRPATSSVRRIVEWGSAVGCVVKFMTNDDTVGNDAVRVAAHYFRSNVLTGRR